MPEWQQRNIKHREYVCEYVCNIVLIIDSEFIELNYFKLKTKTISNQFGLLTIAGASSTAQLWATKLW